METIFLKPVAHVKNNRTEILDDNWGDVISEIIFEDWIPEEALKGLEQFSHIHVIFYFHKVDDSKIVLEARHPRNNPDLPLVGIFAQRAKNRPNKLGITVCKLLEVKRNKIIVQGLDAIDGSPVLDIKPYMVEFDYKESHQPSWVGHIMDKYF